MPAKDPRPEIFGLGFLLCGREKVKTMEERLLKDEECAQMLQICRSTWIKGVKRGIFPTPVRLGIKSVRWRLSEVQELITRGA